MKATIDTAAECVTPDRRAILLDEYGEAIRRWAWARRCNQSDEAPEVLTAKWRIVEIERLLRHSLCEEDGLAGE